MQAFDPARYFDREFAEHVEVASRTPGSVREPFLRLVELAAGTLRSGGKILLFGNGGSAADAQHLATELTVRYARDRAPLPAVALTADGSALTAAGNDLGFEQVFSRQLDALGREGDLALALSTSGRSRNVLRALELARRKRLAAAALSGGDGGELPGLADPLLLVPSSTTARIQELHLALGQMLCGAVERSLGLA
jgi:D-sedoheptulose 7-phosphate isomerase